MAKLILANEMITQVCEAVGVDPMRSQKVVIDLEIGSIPRVYVQMIGDDSLLTVTPLVAEMARVQVLDSNTGSEPK